MFRSMKNEGEPTESVIINAMSIAEYIAAKNWTIVSKIVR